MLYLLPMENMSLILKTPSIFWPDGWRKDTQSRQGALKMFIQKRRYCPMLFMCSEQNYYQQKYPHPVAWVNQHMINLLKIMELEVTIYEKKQPLPHFNIGRYIVCSNPEDLSAYAYASDIGPAARGLFGISFAFPTDHRGNDYLRWWADHQALTSELEKIIYSEYRHNHIYYWAVLANEIDAQKFGMLLSKLPNAGEHWRRWLKFLDKIKIGSVQPGDKKCPT